MTSSWRSSESLTLVSATQPIGSVQPLATVPGGWHPRYVSVQRSLAAFALACIAAGCTATTRVNVSSGDAQANNESSRPALSGDGRFVAFDSVATNLVPGDTN